MTAPAFWSPWDHPRIRGEHVSVERAVIKSAGSSPHTRGAQMTQASRAFVKRIIPAYAGSTADGRTGFAIARDHPRIRGEHAEADGAKLEAEGSSPHTRGARETERTLAKDPGIIPAYAGSTWYSVPRRSTPWDHPRIRGEHSGRRLTPHCRHGSSPHTRGALDLGGR